MYFLFSFVLAQYLGFQFPLNSGGVLSGGTQRRTLLREELKISNILFPRACIEPTQLCLRATIGLNLTSNSLLFKVLKLN